MWGVCSLVRFLTWPGSAASEHYGASIFHGEPNLLSNWNNFEKRMDIRKWLHGAACYGRGRKWENDKMPEKRIFGPQTRHAPQKKGPVGSAGVWKGLNQKVYNWVEGHRSQEVQQQQSPLATLLKVRHAFNSLHGASLGFYYYANVECLGLSKFIKLNLEIHRSHFYVYALYEREMERAREGGRERRGLYVVVLFFCSLGAQYTCVCMCVY